MKNRWSIMSKAGKKKRANGGKRRIKDDYETPQDATLVLGEYLRVGWRPHILEPCAGSGRMAKALKKLWPNAKVSTSDIKRGRDFLKRTKKHKGILITNPPYRDGMAQAMVDQALKLCDGKVAMLLNAGFIWGQRRGEEFFRNGHRPEMIIVIPWRINFFVGGSDKIIDGQFFSHAWVIWPKRSRRANNKVTLFEWASTSTGDT